MVASKFLDTDFEKPDVELRKELMLDKEHHKELRLIKKKELAEK